jgi:hypothetical protein
MKSRDVCFTFFVTHNQKSPILGIQLHFLMSPQCSCIQGFYIVATKGLDINETNGGKVAFGPVVILAIGKVHDRSAKKIVLFSTITTECESRIF